MTAVLIGKLFVMVGSGVLTGSSFGQKDYLRAAGFAFLQVGLWMVLFL